jgi:ABC-type uncharacterized transport system YnjBCD ATPase subunit
MDPRTRSTSTEFAASTRVKSSGIQCPTHEPSTIVPIITTATKHLGVGLTLSTAFEHPYSMCRRLSSLDHLSAGRIAWNIVSSYSKSEWDAYGHSMTDRSGRYERLEEYMGVCYQLWDSWEPGAIIADKASGIYAFRRYAAARHSSVLPGRYRRHRANGAGKTTLLRTILGAVTHRSGAIHFQGRDIASLPVHARLARGIVLVPEGRQIIISLSVEENLLIGAHLRRDIADVKRDTAAIYERFPNLAARRFLAASCLSGGEQQLLAIGRAMMSRPKLMLLDEPSLGLALLLISRLSATSLWSGVRHCQSSRVGRIGQT